jgi:hypothetical protein
MAETSCGAPDFACRSGARKRRARKPFHSSFHLDRTVVYLGACIDTGSSPPLYDGITRLSSPGQPQFARAAAFAAYCFALDPEGRVPVARFELKEIPKLAPYLGMLGVVDVGKDFLIRLAGTKLVDEFFGRDPTGETISQSLGDGEYGKRVRYIVGEVFRQKAPILNQPGRTRLRDKEYYSLETVTFPLVDKGGSVVKIVSLYDFLLQPTQRS